jgi:glycerol-3-phosphate dehydrogenase
VINAAGLHGDVIGSMMMNSDIGISPRRGQFIIFDKMARRLVNGIVLEVPSLRSKGILLAPTVFGNLLLGPTAEDLDDKTDTSTTRAGLSSLMTRGEEMLPSLATMEVTSIYSGLRAVSTTDGYEVTVDGSSRYATATGIRSTGISASMAIAEYLRDLLDDAGLALQTKARPASVTMPPIGEHQLRLHRDESALRSDPSAGQVMCFCELTTLAELEAAATSAIPPTTIDGLFRRTRATGGRCQGFYCRAEITAWLASRSGTSSLALMGIGYE